MAILLKIFETKRGLIGWHCCNCHQFNSSRPSPSAPMCPQILRSAHPSHKRGEALSERAASPSRHAWTNRPVDETQRNAVASVEAPNQQCHVCLSSDGAGRGWSWAWACVHAPTGVAAAAGDGTGRVRTLINWAATGAPTYIHIQYLRMHAETWSIEAGRTFSWQRSFYLRRRHRTAPIKRNSPVHTHD